MRKIYRASKKTAIISALLSIAPFSLSAIIELSHDKYDDIDGSLFVYHQIGLVGCAILLFLGVVVPIFFTAAYHVSPEFMKKNIDNHFLSRFFIMKG